MEQTESRKNRILECANNIIDTEGVRALNVSKIVSRCKISKSTFYKYFSSKNDLISEIKSLSNRDETDFYSIKQEIVQQSIKAFSNNIFENVDMEEIANSVGLKRPSIYRYFSTKEELLEESLKYEIMNRQKFKECLEKDKFEPVEFLHKLFEYIIKFNINRSDNLMFYNVLYYSQINDNIRKILENLWNETIEINEYIFERGKKEGVFKNDINSKLLAQVTFSYIGGLGVFSYEKFYELGDQFIELLLKNITTGKK